MAKEFQDGIAALAHDIVDNPEGKAGVEWVRLIRLNPIGDYENDDQRITVMSSEVVYGKKYPELRRLSNLVWDGKCGLPGLKSAAENLIKEVETLRAWLRKN